MFGGHRRLLAHVLADVTQPFRQCLDRLLLPLEQRLDFGQSSAQTALPHQADDRQHERHERQQEKKFHGHQYVGPASSDG
jgi:hypothetical protein